MKGLIIKDIMCLKKQLALFCFVMFGVLVISIMYVLSIRYGNLAIAGKEMLAENQLSDLDIKNLASGVLVLFMILPIVCVGDMVNVFIADGKAGFAKVSASLPVAMSRRLAARYLTIYVLFGIGTVVDILVAGILSALTNLMSFADFFGIIISVASILSIYSALAIMYCILLGYGKESYAQVFSMLTMGVAYVLINFKSIKEDFLYIISSEQEIDSEILWKPLNLLKEKGYIIFVAAIVVSVLSYLISLWIAERKRGVI